jgi:hypothetical protein
MNEDIWETTYVEYMNEYDSVENHLRRLIEQRSDVSRFLFDNDDSKKSNRTYLLARAGVGHGE